MTKANYLNLIARAEMPDQLRGLSRDASTDPQLFSTDKDEIAAAIQKRFGEINGGLKGRGAWALVALLILSLLQTAAAAQVTPQRLAALSMLESGDNDQAIGHAGEISRYQILPTVFAKYFFVVGRKCPSANAASAIAAANPFTARNIAAAVLQDRCKAFEIRFHRPPTDQEFYILWARPSWYFSRPRLHADFMIVAERATRFESLVNR